MAIEELLKTISKNHPKADHDMVRLAFDLAREAHSSRKRANGEFCYEHNLAVARILADIKADLPAIIAGLLHDLPEDTECSLKDIEVDFGPEICSLVEGIGKLGSLKYRGLDRYAENLRNMFVAMAEDLRVVIIKFADRLHNMESLDALPEKKKNRIAHETMEIYVPIANRLGLGKLKGKLEDNSFRYTQPEEYQWISDLIKSELEKKKEYLRRVKEQTGYILSRNNIADFRIQGRTKDLYSLYKKLQRYDNDINRVYDIAALRVIVKDLSQCYSCLGLLHSQWRPLKGRIKDYIAQPKPNGYQSLHTTVFTPEKEVVEFQIRTEQMHAEAEFGVAAHWYYKEAGRSMPINSKQTAWVKELVKWQKNIEDDRKYLESLRLDVFQNRIFVFTPKGDVINLPEGSTPIDFAYHVHSEIGNTCTGSLVNNQIAPLSTELKSGDVVKIITDKNRKGPNPDWVNMARTNNARGKIRGFMKRMQ